MQPMLVYADPAKVTVEQNKGTWKHDVIPGANHFFANELDLLMKSVDEYLDMRLATDPIKPAIPSRSSRS